ncbi:MAG: hypothetical protein SFU25_10790 [Candidatus Caenarcaniphilales bacterium]|nr:hypothetical protein [Candidatus Caenarcaniphilales bacterium]
MEPVAAWMFMLSNKRKLIFNGNRSEILLAPILVFAAICILCLVKMNLTAFIVLMLLFSLYFLGILLLCIPGNYELILFENGLETIFLYKKYFYEWSEIEDFEYRLGGRETFYVITFWQIGKK